MVYISNQKNVIKTDEYRFHLFVKCLLKRAFSRHAGLPIFDRKERKCRIKKNTNHCCFFLSVKFPVLGAIQFDTEQGNEIKWWAHECVLVWWKQKEERNKSSKPQNSWVTKLPRSFFTWTVFFFTEIIQTEATTVKRKTVAHALHRLLWCTRGKITFGRRRKNSWTNWIHAKITEKMNQKKNKIYFILYIYVI